MPEPLQALQDRNRRSGRGESMLRDGLIVLGVISPVQGLRIRKLNQDSAGVLPLAFFHNG